MAISYKVIPRRKPGTNDFKFYAQAVSQGSINLADIAEDMAAESTVTEHDVKAVLSSLQYHVIKYLKNGMSVRLGDLGSFHVTLSGKGADTADAYNTKFIKYAKVQFRKSARMQARFNIGNGGPSFRDITPKTSTSANGD